MSLHNSVFTAAPVARSRFASAASAAAVLSLLAMPSCGQGSSSSGGRQGVSNRPMAAGSVVAAWPGWPSHRCDRALTGAARSKLPRELRLLWKHDAGEPIGATAAVSDGRIFAATEGGSLLALDAASGERLWSYKAGASIETAPCLEGGRLFVGTSDGTFHAVDAGSGARLWTFKAGGDIKSHPVASGGSVLFGSYDNMLYRLSVSDGSELWRMETKAPVHCGPCVTGESAAVAGCDGFLHIAPLDAPDKTVAVALNDRVAASPAFDGRRFYFGTHGGRIVCVGLEEKAILWDARSREGQPFFASAAIAGGGRVVFAGRDGLVRCLNADDGRELWTFDAGSSVDSSPACAGGRVFFGDKAGVLRALRLEDGKEAWRFEAGGSFSAGPAIGCGILAIGSEDGMLYVFGGDPVSAE